jgi:hypothetical protein
MLWKDCTMELYFGSLRSSGPPANSRSLVIFAIPDIGVKFKAPYAADKLVLEYASLLTLLEFIEINPKLFVNRSLELFSANAELVDQVNRRQVNSPDLAPYLRKALEYRARLKFSINWISPDDSPARDIEID